MCNMKALSLLVRGVMAKVKVFLKVNQTSRSRSRGQKYSTRLKVLSQGIHKCNMKSPISHGKNVMAKVKVF